MSILNDASDIVTEKDIRDYLWRQEGPHRGTRLRTIKDITKVKEYLGFDVWHARLVFADHEMECWVILEPAMNYYLHQGRVADHQTEFATPEAAVQFHMGTLMAMAARENSAAALRAFLWGENE